MQLPDLEHGICQLETLAALLVHIGTNRGQVSTDVVHLIGSYIQETATDLKDTWGGIMQEIGSAQ